MTSWLTKWFPGNAILEPKVGDQVKFSFYKENSERRKRDFFPEGEVGEYIPNKKIAYTWRQSDIPDFHRTVGTWELGTRRDRQEYDKGRVSALWFHRKKATNSIACCKCLLN